MPTSASEPVEQAITARLMPDIIKVKASYQPIQEELNDNSYVIKTAEGKMNGQLNFLAIISRKDNPNLSQAIAEFDETISFLFDPPEESA